MSGEGFGLKEEPTRHCWGAMHPIASLRVASSSFAVMKMTGLSIPMPQADAAAQSRNPPRWMSSSRRVAVCTLSLSSKASAGANVRPSMPWCVNSRATQCRLVIDHDHDCRRRHIRVQHRGAYLWPLGGRPTLDLDQCNLVHRRSCHHWGLRRAGAPAGRSSIVDTPAAMLMPVCACTDTGCKATVRSEPPTKTLTPAPAPTVPPAVAPA
jgi:hypothetical protein